jgi:hypothetical protein
MPEPIAALKRTLRELKQLEVKLRSRYRPLPPDAELVWNLFFSTRSENDPRCKYPLARLQKMDRPQLKAVYEEYFFHVYYQMYRENGLTLAEVYDPHLLSLLGLSPYAGMDEIKQRFRELAKLYHPDRGGDSEQFIRLMETYEQLKGE